MSEKHYRVVWEIDIWAETPKDAAQLARDIQLKPGTTATIFDVSVCVDGELSDRRTIDLGAV